MVNNCLLVILFKLKLGSSPTLQSITKFLQQQPKEALANYRLYIWDNSPNTGLPEVVALQTQLPNLEIRYEHTPENYSLSKIYNTVATELADDEYLTLLDQDTTLPPEYFTELHAAQSAGQPLILPQVRCAGRLVSPGTRFYCKGKLLEHIEAGLHPSKNLLAINSGMSAQGKVFKSIPYDERLKFYGTDTYFMKHYEQHFPLAYIMNATLNHSLAEDDSSTSSERKQQIAQARQDAWKIVFSDSIAERIFLSLYEFALRLRKLLSRS